MTIQMRRAAAVAVLAASAIGLVGCGSDGDDKATPKDGSSTTTTVAPTEPAVVPAAFCEPFLALNEGFHDVPEDQAAMEAFVEETVTPSVAAIRAEPPEEIGTEVALMLDTVDEATATGNLDLFEGPEFVDASAVVYGAMEDQCGIPVVDVDASDYTYTGMPESLPAGTTSFVLHNKSESGELHIMEIVKVKPDVELTAEEIVALPEEEVNDVLETFAGGASAPSGKSGGTVADLTPGRWLYVCPIPMGSIDGQEGKGAPHLAHGMVGELIVE